MKSIQIKAGIVYDGGRVIPWDIFYDTLNGAADQRTTDKIQKKVNDLISFTEILVNQKTDNKQIAEILGLTVIDNDEKLRKNILKKIEKLNSNNGLY